MSYRMSWKTKHWIAERSHMDKVKAFCLGMITMGILSAFIWVSNEAYHEDIAAKANIEKHKEICWYCPVKPLKEIASE